MPGIVEDRHRKSSAPGSTPHDFESRADHGVWIIAALAVLAGVILDLALARWRRKDRRGEL